jgi:hypothetical protein
MDAALGDKAECFFDGRTVRRCRHCRRPVAGGPTACEPCVLRQQGREEAMAEAKKAVGTSADAFAYDRASAALRLEDDALVLYVPKAQRHRVTYSDVLLCPGSAKDERETLAHITEVLAFVIFDAMQQADRAAREEMVTQAKVPATGARTIPVLNLYVLTEAVFDAVRTSPSEAVRAKARNALVDALAPHIAAVHEAALADAQRDHEAALAKAKEDGAREALVAMLDRFNEGCGAAFARTGQKAMLDAAWDLHQCALGVARAEERQEVIGQIKASNERLGERMGTMLGELSDLERRTGHLRAEVQATEHQRFALWDVVKGLEAQDGDG